MLHLMCGRYTETRGTPDVAREFEVVGEIPALTPRYNLAPTQNAPVVVRDG